MVVGGFTVTERQGHFTKIDHLRRDTLGSVTIGQKIRHCPTPALRSERCGNNEVFGRRLHEGKIQAQTLGLRQRDFGRRLDGEKSLGI
jgi:hypothetical protein